MRGTQRHTTQRRCLVSHCRATGSFDRSLLKIYGLDIWVTMSSQFDENLENALGLPWARGAFEHLAGNVGSELFFPLAAQLPGIALAKHGHVVPARPAVAVVEFQIVALLLGEIPATLDAALENYLGIIVGVFAPLDLAVAALDQRSDVVEAQAFGREQPLHRRHGAEN